ncbi:MAG: hypothetical protein LBP95_05590 [Deltaproteobacteria bacterium]|nr:hypothetical protein [Deltaproteobacteria bacterium]
MASQPPDKNIPAPPGAEHRAKFFDPRPAGAAGTLRAYAFKTLGGPSPLGGQKGLLSVGGISFPAVMASAPGPSTVFVMEGGLEDVLPPELLAELNVGGGAGKTPDPAGSSAAVSSSPSSSSSESPSSSESSTSSEAAGNKTGGPAAGASLSNKAGSSPDPGGVVSRAREIQERSRKLHEATLRLANIADLLTPARKKDEPEPKKEPPPGPGRKPPTLFSFEASGPAPRQEGPDGAPGRGGGAAGLSSALPGGDLFLDPRRGWVMAVTEALPGGQPESPRAPQVPQAPRAPGAGETPAPPEARKGPRRRRKSKTAGAPVPAGEKTAAADAPRQDVQEARDEHASELFSLDKKTPGLKNAAPGLPETVPGPGFPFAPRRPAREGGDSSGPRPDEGAAWPEGLWPPLDPGVPPPPGVSFVWALPGRTPELVCSLVRTLAGTGRVLVASGLDRVAELLAGRLGDSLPGTLPRNGLVTLAPRPNPALDRTSLAARTDEAEEIRRRRADGAAAALRAHRAALEAEREKLGRWQKLAAYEKSLGHLREEAGQRKADWEARESDLKAAQDRWSGEGKKSGGLAGKIFPSRRQKKLELAAADLDDAENAMRRTRLEMESLLNDALKVEADLAAARDSTAGLPPAEELGRGLDLLLSRDRELASRDLALSRPVARRDAEALVLEGARAVVAGLGADLPAVPCDSLVVVAPVVTDHAGRVGLAGLAALPTTRLVVVADFTCWSWTAAPPVDDSGRPAWRNFMAAPRLAGPPGGAAAGLGPLPGLADDVPPGAPGGAGPGSGLGLRAAVGTSMPAWVGKGGWLSPDPARHPWLERLGFRTGLARLALNHPAGPALRARGESGPSCPASALAVVRLAVEAARMSGEEDGPAAAYVLAASPTQAALHRALLQDFGETGRVFCGEPGDFANWPRAPLVVLDAALAPPQAGHPWSSPETGRPAMLRALSLASGALAVCASPVSAGELPKNSPLLKLWRSLEDSAWPGWQPPRARPFWEALERARETALVVAPPFDPSWWPPLAPCFLAALRRKVRMAVLAELPPEAGRDYASRVIRDLRLHGANVVLTRGFNDLLAVVDGVHFSLGSPGGPPGRGRWPFLTSLELPLAAPVVTGLLQAPLIEARLGPGGPHNCPLCGWPFLLFNKGRPRGFGDPQPLRLGCLNPSCLAHKNPGPLDGRRPFSSPPVCPEDGRTEYELTTSRRRRTWVCPVHGPKCPSHRHVAGDCPPGEPGDD